MNFQETELKKQMPIGYRAKYLIHLAERFTQPCDNLKALESKNVDFKSTLEILSDFKGFGPYATNHMLVLLGFYNEIPIDTVVISYLKKVHHMRKVESFIKRHYGKWGPFKWWGMKMEKMLLQKNWLGD